jgi:hypothetical protein
MAANKRRAPGRQHGRAWRIVALAPLALAIVGMWAQPEAAPRALAASATIRVDPATQTVPPGAPFTINLIQSADVPTSGAQATISFDPSFLQIVDIQPGPGYASTDLLASPLPDPNSPTGVGDPVTLDQAIQNANQVGKLIKLAAFLSPGSGTVDPGDNVFVTLTMMATTPGTAPIQLSELEMGDDQFNPIEVSGADGGVTIDASAAPPPTPAGVDAQPTAPAGATAAAPGAGATPGASGSPTASSGVLGSSAAPSLTAATLSVAPSTQKVAKEATFTVELKQTVDGSQSAAQATLKFRKDLVEVVEIKAGPGWNASDSALKDAATEANKNGELNLTLNADKKSGPPTSGESTLATVTMRGLPGKEGKSTLEFGTTDVVGSNGESVHVDAKNGEVIVGSASGGGVSAIWIVLGTVVALGVVGGGGFFVRKRMMSA